MKTKMPFDGFFLKNLDEQNGTCKYEEYLRNCKENPLTEEERREWTESTHAAIAELERLNAEPKPTRQAAEPEAEADGTSSPQTPEPAEPQGGCCTGQEAEEAPEVEVTAAEKTFVPQGEGALLLPAEPTVIPEVVSEPKRTRITELVKEDYKNWRDGTRIVFDAGVNSGKTYFILNVLLPWAYQKHRKIIYLCNRVPLRNEIQQEVERLGRTEEKVGCWNHDLRQFVYKTRVTNKYKDTIRVEIYQWMESFCKGNPKGVMNYFKRFNYIVADEYHYLLTDAAINKYIDLSYVTLNELTKYRPVIFMSATAHPFFHRWRDETNEALPENYYHIPSDYSYVERAVFYWTDAEEIKIIRQEARRGKVLVFVDRMSRIRKLVKELEDEFTGEIATACSPYRPEAREFDGLEEVLQDGKLRKRITIVTTVFYNGVNIKDPELICIISRLWDPIVNAQILGRKRPVSKQDTCAVYFKGYSSDRIKQEREHKSKLDIEATKNTMRKWLKNNYWLGWSEMQYKDVKPCILIEKYLGGDDGSLPVDYKFYCMNGKATSVMVCEERDGIHHPKFFFMDRKWNKLPYTEEVFKYPDFEIEKPESMDDAFEIAELLAKEFPFVRVDLYIVRNRIYFGELTFTPAAGMDTDFKFRAPGAIKDTDTILGELLKLPE